jgi:hypothetical protein
VRNSKSLSNITSLRAVQVFNTMPVYSAAKENALVALNEGAGDKDKSESRSAAWASSAPKARVRASEGDASPAEDAEDDASPAQAVSAPVVSCRSVPQYIIG